jgi:multidrug resistance efflux pump
MEISKRASSMRSLDELYFLLVNDLRALIEFDRCFLITHLGGKSRFAAANNQPNLDDKSKLYEEISSLAPLLKTLVKAVILPNNNSSGALEFPPEDITDELKDGLTSYLRSSDCTYFVCAPLLRQDSPIGHLILEFYGDKVPQQFEVLGLINIGPLISLALAEKWMMSLHPEVDSLVEPHETSARRVQAFIRSHWKPITIASLIAMFIIFLFPQYYTVGGEAEIAPFERRAAFCKIDGMIEKVFVAEGAAIKENQVLASLERKDQDYAIETVQREVEILARQAKLLALESDETPSKLAERQILELERRKRLAELAYKKWQSRFLEIIAPVAGIILTKDVESLAGKRMKAGEAFCEIAVPGELVAEIYVPEDKAVLVKPGQEAYLYLNNNPGKGYTLKVQEVSPAVEVVPRLGNVCRVRAEFHSVPIGTKVGMKGVGKIFTERTNLWSVLAHGLLVRWNHLSLYF